MNSTVLRTLVACFVFGSVGSVAQAGEFPAGTYTSCCGIAEANVRLIAFTSGDWKGKVVRTVRSDAKGHLVLGVLPAGRYELLIDGASLVGAVDKIALPGGGQQSTGKSSGASFSIGGSLFGGSSHSSSGHEGSERGHSRSSSGGGIGLGVAIPLGSGSSRKEVSDDIKKPIIFRLQLGTGENSFSTETSYCRDSAALGMRVGFTVLDGARPVSTADLTISLQPANSTLNE